MRTTLPIAFVLLLCVQSSLAVEQCHETAVAIPDNNSVGISIPITVSSANQLIETMSVDLEIDHPWVGDLVVTLQSPSGTLVTLIDRIGIPSTGFPGPFGCGGNDLIVTLSDDASQSIEAECSTTASPVISGEFLPAMSMGAFADEPVEGEWVLTIADHSSYDTGSLVQACLRFETLPACTPDLNSDGELDIFDVLAFIEAFNNSDLLVDYSGDGVLDIFDVLGFIELFNAGCPE